MYRQIIANKRFTLFQCILWRNNSNKIMITYYATTTAAPYLSSKTLQTDEAMMIKNVYHTRSANDYA